jgi:hypothetical protein
MPREEAMIAIRSNRPMTGATTRMMIATTRFGSQAMKSFSRSETWAQPRKFAAAMKKTR